MKKHLWRSGCMKIEHGRILLSFFLILLLCLCPFSFVSRAETKEPQEKKVVRVGFPIRPGLMEKKEDGSYTGYTVDYLNQLTKYLEWDIEYVEVEGSSGVQFSTLLNMLQNGEIDMIGAMEYKEELEDWYLYPSYNYGIAYTVLAVSEEDTSWLEDDFQNWDMIKVAVYPGISARKDLFEKFAEASGFQYQFVNCEKYSDCMEAVHRGEADAVLQTDITLEPGFRSVARFGPSPYYFVVSKERKDLLRDLNAGIYSLLQSYPGLQTELYNKYFATGGNFYISEESKEWIASLGTQRVLFFEGSMPIQDGDSSGGCGIARGYMELLKEYTGLEYTSVVARSYEQGVELIQNGEVDLVAAVPGDGMLVSSDLGIRLSLPYFESNGVYVSALEPGRRDLNNVMLHSANVESVMKTLNHSPDEAAFLDAYCVNYYMHKGELFHNLSIDWSRNNQILYSIGFTKDTDRRLLNIVNRFTKNMTEDMTNRMLYESIGDGARYTFGEFLVVYKWRLLLVLVTAVLIASLYSFFKKNKELQKSKTESERLYQFSKMTEECLFEYDTKRDKLILQNNNVMFPHQHTVNQFHKTMLSYKFHSRNEEICVNLLMEMLEKKIERRSFPMNENGVEVWYKMTVVFIDGSYAIGRIINDNQDIRERKELEKRARIDQLTGLMNRATLEKNVAEYIKGGHQDGVYMLLDLDNFKRINDSLGHREGDRLLCKFAAELEQSFRGTDLKARLGGDEFVVFMPGRIEEIKLSEKLQSFVDYLSKEVFDEYKQYEVTVSIGAAYISARACTAEALYKEADSAMYIAKYGGKNDFFISDGIVCMKRECTNCRPDCRQKEYLIRRGVYKSCV